MNLKIILEFDGTNFKGWQKQKDKRTVCGELEKAFSHLIEGTFKIIGCCRTDSGVHALNYVCNVKIEGNLKLKCEKLKELEGIFIGKHDFRNISAKTAKSGICNVFESYWIYNDSYYDYFIKADRFLYKMVRSIVGLMILYSLNKISKEEIIEILEFKRKFIPYIVPSKGLTLVEVGY